MDKKISELDQALQINNDAVFPISQDNGGTDTTYKVSITQISSEVGEDQTFSNLQTTNKKLVGAINELYQGGGGGGSSTLAGLNDVDIDDQTLSDGQVLKYDSAEDKWINDDIGAGGHTIVADDGTDLTQRANLQFIGAYSEDNSVDDTTEVNVVRNMTKAQFDLLTADEKTGFINTTDETSQIYATEIPMSALDSDTVAEKLDDKVDKTDFDATLLPIESGSATNTKDYIDNRGLGDLSNVVLTSPQATQMLQFANVGGQLKIVNTSRNAIRHTTVSGTTDSTGDILCSDLPLASYQILSAYKNRNIAGQSAVAYCILGANNNTHPYIHCIKSDNTNLASTAVTIEVYYVEI